MKKIEERDYSHLEGKEIVYIDESVGKKCKAIVANIEYDIGFSIASSCDQTFFYFDDGTTLELKKGDEMACIHGESSPHGTTEHYKAFFASWVAQVKRGFYSTRKTEKMDEAFGIKYRPLGSLNCSFK